MQRHRCARAGRSLQGRRGVPFQRQQSRLTHLIFWLWLLLTFRLLRHRLRLTSFPISSLQVNYETTPNNYDLITASGVFSELLPAPGELEPRSPWLPQGPFLRRFAAHLPRAGALEGLDI